MSWITIVWTMDASVSLTLAAVYLLVWFQQRERWGYLLFALSALGAASVAVFEFLAMHATSVAQYATILRWAHVPIWLLIVSTVWFARLHLHAGRPLLAWVVMGVRTLALALNFLVPTGLSFKTIYSLRKIQFLGESVVVANGQVNPWVRVGQLCSLLLLIFLIDASVTVWRRGERKRAIFLGGSMIFFITAGAINAALVQTGNTQLPYLISFAFLGIVLVMGYESSREVLRAARLATDLQESQQDMKLAAKASGLTVWNWDMKRNLIWVTSEGRPLYGVSPNEEMNFERFLAMVHPDDRGPVQEAIEQSIDGDGEISADYRIVLPNTAVMWISAVGKVEFNGGGKPMRMHGISLDITDRKQVEMEALQQRNELAHLSRVTMLGELSGSLAHELNQPLTAILSNAQAAQRFLDEKVPDLEEIREILGDIVSEDQRAGEVIRRLRLLLKKGEVQKQRLDANEIVRDVLKLVRSDLMNQDVTVDMDLAPNLPAALGDRVQLQQVLLNLVMNGCDAMADHDQPDRRLTLRTALIEKGWLRIDVSDAGRGLPDDLPGRVFEPFFTTKPHGMGLGLSVCHTIITAHGGILGAVNNASGGATFHFTLPLDDQPLP